MKDNAAWGSRSVTQNAEPLTNTVTRTTHIDKIEQRSNNGRPVAQATGSQVFDNNIEILDAAELAAKLKVKVSWIIDHCSKRKCRDPLPVLRIGKHRRFRWNSREMNAWLDRRAGVSM